MCLEQIKKVSKHHELPLAQENEELEVQTCGNPLRGKKMHGRNGLKNLRHEKLRDFTHF